MKITIAWLYYDILDLYGDRGNIKVFESILNNNDIEFAIDKITLNDNVNLSDYDIVFLGGGSDKAQQLISKDLFKRKEELKEVMNKKGFILTVCGGYQMFGKYYLDSKNNKIPGLSIFDYYTVAGDKRSVGNIKIEALDRNDEKYDIVGFENHGGETYGVGENFFGVVIEGNGNKYKDKYEGYKTNNFLGTYIHGPLLPKNPKIAKEILEQIIKEKYNKDMKLKVEFLDTIEKAKKSVKY